MFTNGPITRGQRAQTALPVKERNYIYCRGTINDEVSGGLTAEGYTNVYNNRVLGQGKNNVPLPTASNGDGIIELDASTSFVYMLGTGTPVKLSKRFLVVEAKAHSIPSGETNTNLFVKLSQSKELGDDGNLFLFTLTTSFQKFYIDLSHENVTGEKFIAILNGLLASTTMSIDVKRIYLTNIRPYSVINAYDGDATVLSWQGWTGTGGTNNPGTIETNDIYLEGDGNKPTSVKTSKKANVTDKNFVGVKYNVIERSTNANLFFGLMENGEQIASAYLEMTQTGEGTGYIRISGYPINNSGNMATRNNPISGEYELILLGTKNLKIKITKVWMQ